MAPQNGQFQPFPPSSSAPTNSTSRPSTLTKPIPVDLSALQKASRALLEQHAKDAQIIPDLGEALTASGQASATYSIHQDNVRLPFQKKKYIAIPDGLFKYYESANVTSHMGLMVELERVWIAIDHKLFLWDYTDGQDISSFVDQPDVITSVAVVRPKKGLFIDDITSLLVICTPVSVLLIGVASSSQPGSRTRKKIELYATDLMISTDIEMSSVIGTRDGRIFMCGQQDGILYELHYQEHESWFGKRVQIINHSVGSVQSLLPRFASTSSDERVIMAISDLKRNCFYTLSSRNTISMYTPSGDKSIQHIQTLSSLYKSAQDRASGSPALTPQTFQIMNIHVVDISESRSGVQLMAITTNGVRLYFAPSQRYGYSSGSSSSTHGLRPLDLVHVRLPPMNLLHPDEQPKRTRPPASTFGGPQLQPQPTSRPYIVSTLDNSSYANGLTIAAQPGETDGSDYIFCLSPDLTRIGNLGQLNMPPQPPQPQYSLTYGDYSVPSTNNRPPFTEYAALVAIPGRTWGMAAVPKTTLDIPSGTSAPSDINELATQFGEPARKFMLLTNVGLTFIFKRRAIDFLKAVLEDLQAEGNVQAIVEFRDSFGRDQTCSMLLGLASGNTFLDPEESSYAGAVSSMTPEIAAVAKQAFYDFGERPIWTERNMYGTAENKGTAIFSGRREGFVLYFARLVRPVWKLKITSTSLAKSRVLNVSDTLLVNIQKNLFALQEFLTRNPHLFHSSPSEPTSSRTAVSEHEAWKVEQNSVNELQSLLTRTIEAFSFMLLLNDYHLGELISKCDLDVQKLIDPLTFEDLITTQHGMTISRALVNVVIDQQIGQQLSVDTISEILQHRCGSFCSTDDVMLYKAKENIRKAAELNNPAERQKHLAEALRLFSQGAHILEFEKLREVIGDFQQLNYAKGTINLPLVCAQTQDSDNAGLECWHSGLTPNDPRYLHAEQRIRCYELVLDSLTVFEEKCTKAQGAGISASVGSPGLDYPETVRSHAYELAFASEDEMFHSTLYDWLISRNLADDLLEMRPTFLEAHLRREPVTVQKFQLLWQFYVKNGQPLRAAEVLGALAESTQFDLHLDVRLEYLTLAVANAKSHPISVGGRHETAIAFLTDLEEKLDVAQVQLEVYNILLPHVNDDPVVGERINSLSKQLFTMTDLYQKFAIPFDLATIKLLCLHVSEHRDESVVKPIWNQIFDEIMQESDDPKIQADSIMARTIPLGQRFYPSESAFPVHHISTLIVRFLLANKAVLPTGWAARLLIQCGIQFPEIWELFHGMYESQVPPFNDQANVQAVSSEIAVLFTDWLSEATRPQATVLRAEFPAGRIDGAIDQYLAELNPDRAETRDLYENAKRLIRRFW